MKSKDIDSNFQENKNTNKNGNKKESIDELNEENFKVNKTNEKYGFIFSILSQFIMVLNFIQLKTYKPWFPQSFSHNSLI